MLLFSKQDVYIDKSQKSYIIIIAIIVLAIKKGFSKNPAFSSLFLS